MTDENKDLFYLKELTDYKVASDYPDVRGWDVTDADNRSIGKVTSLLVSKKEERVVYLDVEVDKALIEDGYKTFQTPAVEGVHGFVNKEGDDHLIVPIGMVDLDEEQRKVRTDQINYSTFTNARRFPQGTAIDREYELSLFRHYIGDDAVGSTELDDRLYKGKKFDISSYRKGTKTSS